LIPTIRQLVEAGLLGLVDAVFAAALGRLAGEGDPLVLLGAATARAYSGQGHVCVDLGALGDRPVAGWEGEPLAVGSWPSAAVWGERLRSSALVSRDGVLAPLVLEGDLLYLHRAAETEARLAKHLVERMTAPQRLSVVTGGPGTGKTSALAQGLALVAEQFLAAEGRLPRIALAAPTGKAAARMSAAIGAVKRGERTPELRCSPGIAAAIPDQASTLHRLLGAGRGSGRRFAFHARSRLPFDVIAVDEASMVDLELMTALFDATPVAARVILLGDRHQLAAGRRRARRHLRRGHSASMDYRARAQLQVQRLEPARGGGAPRERGAFAGGLGGARPRRRRRRHPHGARQPQRGVRDRRASRGRPGRRFISGV
jgi:exodeoxyribonuclease V alpha subunit